MQSFPTVTTKQLVISRPSPDYNSNVTTEWLAISRLSPKYNSTISKSSVSWDTNNDHLSLFPSGPLSCLPFQDHLLSITLLVQRALSWETLAVTVQSLSPVSPLGGLPLQDHFLSVNEKWGVLCLGISQQWPCSLLIRSTFNDYTSILTTDLFPYGLKFPTSYSLSWIPFCLCLLRCIIRYQNGFKIFIFHSFQPDIHLYVPIFILLLSHSFSSLLYFISIQQWSVIVLIVFQVSFLISVSL